MRAALGLAITLLATGGCSPAPAEAPAWKPTVILEMSSEVANRYLQGRENIAIAIARGMIRASCDVRAALNLLPISRQLSACYREVLERDYPHLLLD